MDLSARGIALLQSLEGYRSLAYRDIGGVWTLGYGTTRGVKQGDTCNESIAHQWLLRDTAPAARVVTGAVKVPLTQNQFDALVLFVYNVGVGAFLGVRAFQNPAAAPLGSTMLRKLNAGDMAGAAAEFPRWDRVTGAGEVPGLLARREREQALFRSQQGD